MNITKKNLSKNFIIVLFLIFSALLFDLPNFTFFAPFLVMVYYQRSFAHNLWISFGCGLILDMISFDTPLGFYASTFLVVSAILFHQRKNFFSDNLSTMPLMVFFFSFLSLFFQIAFISFLERQMPLSKPYLIQRQIFLPVMDAVIAFFLFIFPYRLFGKKPRKGTDYFTNRAKGQ